MNILDRIVERTKERIREEKRQIPLCEMRARAEGADGRGYLFEEALRKEGLSFICEVKKASPSKGVIASEFPYLEIAKDYEMGASAILLICSVLDDGALKSYHQLAEELGMSALVEAHSQEEIERAKAAGARIIGVNNRDLKNFTVDIGRSMKLRKLVGPETLFVSESGIRGPEDMRALYESGTDAVLIGEMLMRSLDRKETLRSLQSAAAHEKDTGNADMKQEKIREGWE